MKAISELGWASYDLNDPHGWITTWIELFFLNQFSVHTDELNCQLVDNYVRIDENLAPGTTSCHSYRSDAP